MERYLGLNDKISYKKKVAHNYKWYNEKADLLISYGSTADKEKEERIKRNWDLYNSRAKDSDFNDEKTIMANAMNELAAGQMVSHKDILSPIINTMVGKEEKSLFAPLCIDISEGALNEYRNKRTELIQQYLHQEIIQPIIDSVTQEVMMESEGQELNPEQQQQQQQQIQQEVERLTPQYINKYLRKEYKSSTSILGQKLLNYLIKNYKLRNLFNLGFKSFLVTGTPCFYGTLINNKLHVEAVNAAGLTYGGNETEPLIHKKDWWVYRKGISLPEVYRKYGKDLTKKDIKILDDALDLLNTPGKTDELTENRITYEISLEPESVRDLNLLTSEGQEAYSRVYAKALHNSKGSSPIEEIHCAWKALTLFKYVTRIVDGEEKSFFVDGLYEENIAQGDISVEEAWVPQICQTTVLMVGAQKIYLKQGPLEEQYDSLDDIHNVEGPYFGFEWGNYFGETKGLAPIDRGKTGQAEYNVIRSKLINTISKDKGKVLMTIFKAKPSKWELEEWLDHIDNGNLIVDTDLLRGVDHQLFKSIDLGTIKEVVELTSLLDKIREETAKDMGYNQSMLGEVSPYMTATNNQQNIMQSLSQTEDIYNTFNELKLSFLTYTLKLAKAAARNNPQEFLYILDDMSLAELKLDPDTLGQAKYGVFITNGGEEAENLKFIKSDMQAMIQNQLLSFPDLIKTRWSTSGTELLNIAEEAEEKREKQLQAQAEEEKRRFDLQLQQKEESERRKEEIEMLKFQMKLENDLEMKLIDSLKYAKQYDIDQDGINDNLEISKQERESKEKEGEKERAARLKELRETLRNNLEIKKLELKKAAATKKSK